MEKESKIPSEDSLTLLIYASTTNVSTAKNSKQLYLLSSIWEFTNIEPSIGKKFDTVLLWTP